MERPRCAAVRAVPRLSRSALPSDGTERCPPIPAALRLGQNERRAQKQRHLAVLEGPDHRSFTRDRRLRVCCGRDKAEPGQCEALVPGSCSERLRAEPRRDPDLTEPPPLFFPEDRGRNNNNNKKNQPPPITVKTKHPQHLSLIK